MEDRRQFIKKITSLFSGITILSGILPPFLKSLCGKEPDILLAGDFIGSTKNVSRRKIEVTPLKYFGVMGATDIQINKDEWNLEISNKEGKLIKYTYDEILKLPSFEKKVVLTCPGFFKNHGFWKGFSLGAILEKKGLVDGVKKVEITGLNGRKDRSIKFPLKSVLKDHVFLAYGVNREILPGRNGFPLRVVAQKHLGSNWVKYVNKVNLI